MKSHCKRMAAFLLALALSFSLMPAAWAAESFSDVGTDHWAYDAIRTCAENDLVNGYENGTFRPGGQVTNAEFTVMAVRALYGQKSIDEAASGLESGAPWYMAAFLAATGANMLEGTSFEDPDLWTSAAGMPMTRADMSVLAAASCFYGDHVPKDPDAALAKMTDTDQLEGVYRWSVGGCLEAGLLTGYPDGSFSPNGVMTRAEACVVADRMRRAYNGEDLTKPTASTQPQQPDQPTQPEPPAQTGSGKLANGQDITIENVLAILDEIKQEYPDGTVWGDRNTANNNYYKDGGTAGDMVDLNKKFLCDTGYRANLAYGCGGWACMITERIFGKTGYPFREVTDLMNVRPGDVIIHLDSNGRLTHYSVVTSTAYSYKSAIDGSTKWKFDVCGGNGISNGIGRVYWEDSNAPTNTAIKVYTRYPE